MRNLSLFLLGLLFFSAVQAQSPVSWSYSAKKIAAGVYEIHLIATVQSPWHIYSQITPDGGPVPTKISFSKNPLVTMEGTAKEVGKLVTKHEEVFGVDVKYFEGTAEFVQTIKLKNKIKTSITASVEFMVCNDVQCLPPTTKSFDIALQ